MLATKRISTSGIHSIALQNENGPCPLIAITNTLVLRDSSLAAYLEGKQQVSTDELTENLAGMADDKSDMDALARFLPNLVRGLDVNPKFDGSFAPSPELEVFRSFGVPVVHGWVLGDIERMLLGADDGPIYRAAREMSYDEYTLGRIENSLEPSGIGNQDLKPSSKEKASALLDLFTAQFPSQVSESGLAHIQKSVKPGVPAVLFLNNHFSTVAVHNGHIYTLVTDEGYKGHSEIVWERLNGIAGDGELVGGDFEKPVPVDVSNDAALAEQLQREEDSRNADGHTRRVRDRPQSARTQATEATHRHTKNSRSIQAKSQPKPKKGRCIVS